MAELCGKFIVSHPFFQGAKDQLQLCYDSYGSVDGPRCTPILGPSGCGKSTMIEDYIRSLNRPTDSREKLVVVVETPSNPTVKSMASEVLQAIGDPLYFRGSEVQMTDRIIKLLKHLGTRLLIFDEIQNLIDKESDKLSFKASDWLKRLINMSKIPTAIVALERAEELFIINEQLRRRFTESYIIEAFDWEKPNSQLMLKGFLKAVQKKYKFSEGLEIFSHDIAFRFYCASGGLVGYIMSIVREAEQLAKKNRLPIGIDDLAQAYNIAVCGNRLVGVNPFVCKEDQKIEVALKVVESVKHAKRLDKKRD